MLIYVWTYNGEKFEKTHVIDYAESVIWVSRYRDCGEFEIYIPASKELVELFQGEVLFTRNESDTTMVLEKIQLTTDAENGDYLIVSGRSLESVLSRRVVHKQTTLEGTLEDGIRKLLNDIFISPPKWNKDRMIPNMKIGSINQFKEDLNKQITGENVLDVMIDICTSFNIGFKLNNKQNINEFVFSLYSGDDVSDKVIFSPKFGNLSKTEYSFDYTVSPNFIYVAGQGEGEDRALVGYEADDANLSELEGLSRKEYYIDQRNCETTSLDPVHDTFYLALLHTKGREKYQELKPVVNYSGEILDNGMYKYGEDYFLGDTVLIENDYGIKAKATIVEITEVEDETGYKIVPKLSEWRVVK